MEIPVLAVAMAGRRIVLTVPRGVAAPERLEGSFYLSAESVPFFY